MLSLWGRFSSLELTPPLPPIAERHQAGASPKAPTLLTAVLQSQRFSPGDYFTVREARRKKRFGGTVV